MTTRGFTLVELSIVLVIIGLLIGGILIAQSMISAAKINRIISNLQQYEIALDNFHTNYKQFPGDSTFFSNPGDGDSNSNEAGVNCAQERESYNSFAHLTQAGMLKGNYTLFCSGPDVFQYTSNPNAGVVYPMLTDAKVNYAGALPGDKSNIYIAKLANSKTMMISFTLPPREFVPIEEKLQSQSVYNTALSNGGLYNSIGKGNCTDGIDGYVYKCLDMPDATYGSAINFVMIK